MKTTSEKNISDDIILNEARYKNCRKFWDGCESDTASEDFAELQRVEAGEHDSSDDGGEAVEAVACKDNVHVRNSKVRKMRIDTRTETREGDERDTKDQLEAWPPHHDRFQADQTLVPETMQAPLALTAGTRLQPQCGALALHAEGMSRIASWKARAHVSTLLRRKQVLV